MEAPLLNMSSTITRLCPWKNWSTAFWNIMRKTFFHGLRTSSCDAATVQPLAALY